MTLRKIVLLLTVTLAVARLQAREKSDVIVMKNGDRITCEVKQLSSDTLYISVDYILNTLSVDWTKVDHIDSKQLFLVKTEDGTVYRGLSVWLRLQAVSGNVGTVKSDRVRPIRKVTKRHNTISIRLLVTCRSVGPQGRHTTQP